MQHEWIGIPAKLCDNERYALGGRLRSVAINPRRKNTVLQIQSDRREAASILNGRR
jgi:hypothetical protein